jgi:hypothetical protein
MTKALLHAQKTEHILSRWLEQGHAAHIGLYEVIGVIGAPLANVKTCAQTAFSKAFGGEKWSESARQFGVVGQINSLRVSGLKSGAWVFRRWTILAAEHEIGDELRELAGEVSKRWRESMAGGKETIGSHREVAFLQTSPNEIPAIAKLLTGATSLVDASSGLFEESLASKFGLDSSSEYSPKNLAERYRQHSSAITDAFEFYDHFGGDARTGWEVRLSPEGPQFGIGIHERAEFMTERGVVRKRPNKNGRFWPLFLNSDVQTFVEYAVTLKAVASWSANRSKRVGGAEWNALLTGAAKLRPIPEPFPIRKREVEVRLLSR